jgi:hypothetical protein
MLRVFAITTILLTGVDHWTTYLCLHAPINGWSVVEANPIAEWLFSWAGLGIGLMIDSCLTLVAVVFLATTTIFGRTMRVGLLAIITVATGYAVFNNLGAISRMGIDPWAGIV